MNKKRKLFGLITILLGLVLAVGIWIYQNKYLLPHTTTITFTENGYKPKAIRVNPGETVRFINQSDRQIWPASDPHPTHTNYSGFDPGNFVDPDSEWAFTFNQTGSWRYHDHLRPAFTGSILVSKLSLWGEDDPACQSSSALDQKRCWDNQLRTAFESGGITKAFKALKKLYDTQPVFAASCHSQAHLVGDFFYAEYAREPKDSMLKLPHETVYCGYGFYHGLFEHLFRDKPDIAGVRDFCNKLTDQLSDTIPRIRLNCFHGAGHGFVATPNESTWGNAQALVDRAMPLCEQVSTDENEVQECLQGAFNVLSAWMFAREYGLDFDESNFLEFCDQQTNRQRQLACYYELGMYLGMSTDDHRTVVKNNIVPIKDLEISKTILNVVVASWMQKGAAEPNQTENIKLCNELSEDLHETCLLGLIGGLMAHGKPGYEYEKSLAFCQDEALRQTDHDFCYKTITDKFKETYTQDKVQELCKQIPADYQKYCQ